MILVTTPTGNTGHLILRQLVEAGQSVRAFARDPHKIPDDLRAQIEIVQGSLLDLNQLTQALQGCKAVYYCIPQATDPTDIIAYYEHFANIAVEAIHRAGTQRVVYLSGAGKASPIQNAGTASALFRAEDILAASGASLRALRCPVFFESMLWQIEAVTGAGMFFVAIPGDYPLAQVAVKDIAAVAVKWLTDATWTGVEGVGVLGPENISNNQVAEWLSEALGKPIRFQALTKAQNLKNLTQFGISEALANGVADMYDAISHGLFDAEPRTAESTTPTTMQQWIAEVFIPASQQPSP